MLLDAHTHLDHYSADDLPAALAEIERRRILTVAVSTDPESYARTRAIAAQSPLVLPCFGVHPWEAHRYEHDLDALAPLIADSPMLGEIGLDYILDEDPAHYPAQRAVLATFLQQAAARDAIVSLHTKGAEHDILAMLDRFAVRRAIVHWYSGPHDVLAALAARGCWFSFGVATVHSEEVRALAQSAPLDCLLTETDGPGCLGLFTGEVGMPSYIVSVLEALAGLRGLTVAELQATVAANWRRLLAGDERLAPWAAW